jgi:hypothetical protein
MPPVPAKWVELTPSERRKIKIPVDQAAFIKGLSVQTFKEQYPHLIKEVSKGRRAVELGAVLDD